MIEKIPRTTAILAAANVILFFLAEIFSGSTLETGVLITWGGAYLPALQDGQYWRLFTAMFTHSGIRHLLNNMLLLCLLGSVLETQLGPVRYAVLYLLSGVLANVISWRLYLAQNSRTLVFVGASGAVFAVMGALLWIIIRNKGRLADLSLRSMLILLGFSLYFGFVSEGISNEAHISGLLLGFLFSVLLYRKPKTVSNISI
ncbi:MAG: rhomboid family intramembrane serine protease [Lachnospiraceae bacterium]|nr:rhomboid family intramembrane serine protease [Lachnospiraceae bacterium]